MLLLLLAQESCIKLNLNAPTKYLGLKWHPPCAGVLVLGSDGEVNMINAMLRTLSSAVHLRCDLHMKDNISSKLSSLGICHSLSKEYMSDIFGKGEEGGLIHCSDAQEFDDAVTKLKPVWEERHSKGAEFVKYFIEKKASDRRVHSECQRVNE